MPENDSPWLQKHLEPRSFQIQITDPKIWSARTKTVLPYNFCFIKFFPSRTVEAVDAPHTLFRAPWPRGLGYRVETYLRTFTPSKYIPMPNFTQIGQMVWISIGYEYIYFVLYILDIYCALYIRLREIKNSLISVYHPFANICLYLVNFANICFVSIQIQLVQ